MFIICRIILAFDLICVAIISFCGESTASSSAVNIEHKDPYTNNKPWVSTFDQQDRAYCRKEACIPKVIVETN